MELDATTNNVLVVESKEPLHKVESWNTSWTEVAEFNARGEGAMGTNTQWLIAWRISNILTEQKNGMVLLGQKLADKSYSNGRIWFNSRGLRW